MSRPIPEIRKDLLLLAGRVYQRGARKEAAELRDLVSDMYRRSPRYARAKPTRGSLTPQKAKDIRAFKRANPLWSNRDIGEAFGVDGGRVSEAIQGDM